MEQKHPLDPIPSPYNAPIVTPEILEQVRKLTGAKAVFIVISDEALDHECIEGQCKGHSMNINSFGFTENQVMGIANVIAHGAGYKLVPIDESNDLIR